MNRIIAAPHPSLIRRTCKLPTAGNEDTSPHVNGTGLPDKGRIRRAAGPEVPCPHINTRAPALHRKFFKLSGNYLSEESPLCLSMATWSHHIDRFDRQYDKAITKDPLIGVDLIDSIHKRVQVSQHSCNTTSIKDVELGALAQFGGLNKKV